MKELHALQILKTFNFVQSKSPFKYNLYFCLSGLK